MRIERYGTIVIGAGSAGLSAGYHLARRGMDFVILSDEARVGDNWRRRWDSLRLFTPARYSGLPGMPFPASPYHLPNKDEVADYQERYASGFDLPVSLNTKVESLTRSDGHFTVKANGRTFQASNVIVATGACHTPRIPQQAKNISRDIKQLHSSDYRSPFDLPETMTLVVGAGNSGAQIAVELAKHRKVWLSGRNTGHKPRRVLGRDMFDWLWPVASRMSLEGYVGQRIRKASSTGDALIGIPERSLVNAGVTRVGRFTDVRAGRPLCGDTSLEVRTIVWCTGFVPSYEWIDLPVRHSNGALRQLNGVSSDINGLYFVGLPYQRRIVSSLLGGVGADAAYITRHLAAREERM